LLHQKEVHAIDLTIGQRWNVIYAVRNHRLQVERDKEDIG
jgi:hypothetical protein